MPAARLLWADGLAETILVVNHGLSSIISTTGRGAIEAASHFEDFLASFAFLE